MQTIQRRFWGSWCAGCALLAAAACEPATLTEARERLNSGPADTLVLALPILTDTLLLADAVEDADTASTASGAFGVQVDRQRLDVGVADALSFDDIVFDVFSLGYDGLLQTIEVSETLTVSAGSLPPVLPPGPATVPAPAPPFPSSPIQFETGSGASVVSAEIGSGFIVRTVDNTTNCSVTTAVSLRDGTGTEVASFPAVAVAAGEVATDSVDLAGVVIDDVLDPDASASVSSCSGIPAGSLSAGFTVRPLTMASVTLAGIDETFSGGYRPLSARFDPIDTVEVSDGTIVLDVTTRVPLELTVDLEIAGLLELGAPLTRSIVIPAAPPGGSRVESIELDLGGARLIPPDAFVNVVARARADTAVVTPDVVTQAADIDGSGRLEVALLVGRLDPGVTPELTQSVDVEEPVFPRDIDFGDLEDAARDVIIHDAEVSFSIDNGIGVGFALDTVTIGVTRTDAFGAALRNGDGSYAFEEDGAGNPILIPLAPPGSTLLEVPAGGATAGRRQAAALVDRVVDLLLDDETVVLVATGAVAVGDGTQGRVSAADSVSIAVDLVVGFDFVLPDSGLVFDVTESFEGAALDSADIEEIEGRLIDAGIVAEVVSDLPLELSMDIVLLGRPIPDSVDAFAEPDRIDVGSVVVPPAPVDPVTGESTGPVTDSVRVFLTGSDVTALLGDSASVGVRFRVQGDASSGRRARLRTDDVIGLRLRAVVRALLGGQP